MQIWKPGLIAIVVSACALPALGATPISVSLNDRPLAATAIVRSGRVLLPFRAIFRALHAGVTYRSDAREVTAKRAGDSVLLRIGSRDALVNGRHVILDVAPQIIGDRTFVPVRFVAQSLGGRVQYDAADRIVFISDPRAQTVAQTIQPPSHRAPEVRNLAPAPGQISQGGYPMISASIVSQGSPVDRGRLQLFVDGREVSNHITFDGTVLSYTPSSAFGNGPHTISVQGTDLAGDAFSREWTFTNQYVVNSAYSSYPSQFAAINFYIPSNAYTYYPGQRVQFVLVAPPGGIAYLQLCGFNEIPFLNPFGSDQYFLSFIVPVRLQGRACSPIAYYTGALGSRTAIPLHSTLEFARPQPTATPQPAPLPTPQATPAQRTTEPVYRQPLSATSRPSSRPKPRATTPPQGKPAA
ncbi:MAG: hypothetical protein NVSMB31_17600 [Vulcanimicrobiaceae bacterium]